MPIISKILNIFEPIIFPIAISLFPFIAAVTLVTSSGKLVPTAKIVKLINSTTSFLLSLYPIYIVYPINTQNRINNIIASCLEIPVPVLQKYISNPVTNKHIGISYILVSFWNVTGLIKADNPNINNKLLKLLPITFPYAISD